VVQKAGPACTLTKSFSGAQGTWHVHPPVEPVPQVYLKSNTWLRAVGNAARGESAARTQLQAIHFLGLMNQTPTEHGARDTGHEIFNCQLLIVNC
jgi:hypothetical protein